ncbi:hypothetical protein V2W45_1239001, partial [Cenococcum geophilum]
LIEDARSVIANEKVNEFDQHRVNSFIRYCSSKRPILIKLKEGTYGRYKGVGKQLLTFVYCLVYLR